MPTRRFLLSSAAPAVFAAHSRVLAAPATVSFHDFLTGFRADARRSGIAAGTLDRAFAGLTPNQKVLERDRHQPEFTMTWARYRALVVTEKRVSDGRQAVAVNRALFDRVHGRFAVAPGVIAGIWGLESSFGAGTGDFHVIEALATLAWDGRRASFFRGELLAACKILDHGDVSPSAMTGSYAGAMGQPQFMPSSYLRYAVDFEGSGRRDIWTSRPDVLGSIANYLAHCGWRDGQTWGQAVSVPAGFTAEGRDAKRPLSEWTRAGVRPISGRWAGPADTPAGIVAPDGIAPDGIAPDGVAPNGVAPNGNGGETFAVFNNFAAIRRYNPSDFYAIAVGLIGDQVAG